MREMNQQRIEELEASVRKHSDLYFNGTPEITDPEFDALIAELTKLDPGSLVLAEVGARPSFGRKVKHPSLMGSLDKVSEFSSLDSWWRTRSTMNSSMVCTPKVDGLAIRLKYKDGKLEEAATRGDGEIGQDVTPNACQVKDIPQTLANGFTGEVRGEVYMLKSVWEKSPFANARNGAAGGMRQEDATETARRELSFLAYSIRQEGKTFKTEMEARYAATTLGIPYVDMEVVDPAHLQAYLLDWEKRRRMGLPFDIDGLVFSFYDIGEGEDLGWTGRKPNGKLAWKFPPEQREAKVVNVQWQVGRTGKVTPVLEVEPVKLSGSVVQFATLHSAELAKDFAFQVGDKVLLEKAGDVIPHVVRVTWRAMPQAGGQAPLILPSACPCCGSLLVQDGAHLWCMNLGCSSRVETRILHWLDVMGVKGFGPSTVSSLCANGVKSPADLYYLTKEQLADSVGEKLAETLWNELFTKTKVPLSKFLAALGVPDLGGTISKVLAKKYGTLEAVLAVEHNQLVHIEGIGSKTGYAIVNGLASMRHEIDAVSRCVEIEAPVTGGVLTGKSFCLTGAMGKPRKEIERMIEEAGGEVKGSVGRGLGFLVTNDTTSGSAKNVKAQSLGVQIVDEAALYGMMGL
jgi:DNA ligase (NAD+)